MRFRAPNQQEGQDELVGGVGNLFRSLAMAPQIRQQAAQQLQQQQEHSALVDSQRRQNEAQIGFLQGKAQEQADSNDRTSFGGLVRGAALRTGIPQSLVPDAQGYLDTGALPNGKYSTSDTFEGPPQVLPTSLAPANLDKFRSDVANVYRGLQLGDKSDTIARAGAIDNAQALRDRVVAGTLDAGKLGAAQAAMEGKAQFDNIGNTGSGYNVFTGEGQTLDPGLAVLFSDESKSTTGANDARAKASRAAASNSYASAAQHQASTKEINQRVSEGVKTGQIQVITDNDGNVSLLNKATGIARPATTEEGLAFVGKGPKLKDIPPNVNSKIIDAQQGVSNIDSAIKAIENNPRALGISNAIPGVQTAKQFFGSDSDIGTRAQVSNIGSLVLHDRSGAAVSASEFPRLAPFIPSASDNPKAAISKLKEMKRIAEDELGLYSQTYGPDSGYRQNSILQRRSTDRSAPAAAPSQNRNVTVDY